jgi:hypothetical protein
MQQLTLTQAPTPAQLEILSNINPNTKWVAGRKIKLVEKSENRATHSFSDSVHAYGTITYMDPKVFALASTGSLPCGDYDHKGECDSQKPADVTEITLARLMQARDSYRPQTLTCQPSPYDEGQMAAQRGMGEGSNPYDIWDHEAHFEWLAGFEDGYE